MVTLLEFVPPIVGAAGAIGSVGHRALIRRRTLTREVIDLIPSRQFDPDAETLMRLASAIASVRRPGPRPTRAADSVRIALVTVPPGRLGYRLEAPADMLAQVRPHLPAGLSVREPAPPDPEDWRATARYTARREMVLARPDGHLLAAVPLDPDPLTAFAKVFALVADDEDLTVCFDLMALSHERHAAVGTEREAASADPAQRAQRVQRDWGTAWRQFSQPLGGHAAKPSAPTPARGNTARSRANPKAATGTATPLFHVQVLARATAATRTRARALVVAATGAPLRQWAQPDGGNWWEPRALLGRPTADWPLVRDGFDARFEGGTFPAAASWVPKHRPARVTATEIAGLLKPPTAKNGHADLRRSGAAAPPPRGLLPLGPGVRPLGWVDGYDQPVGTSWDEFFFGAEFGKTRWGKTNAALVRFLSWVADPPYGLGLGGAFVDPAGDAIGDLEPFAAAFPGRGLVINLGRAWEDLWLPCWNPFDAGHASPQEANAALGAVTSAFQAATKWSASFAPRATAIVVACGQALIALAVALAEAGSPLVPTFFQIPTLINNEPWRKAVMRHLPRQTRSWWEDDFPRLPKDAPLTVTNLINRLRANVPTAAFLGGPSTFDFRKAMDARWVLFFSNARKGDGQDALPTSLFVRGLLMGGSSRADTPADVRATLCPKFLTEYDEAPTYDGPDLAVGLQEQGKYNMRAEILSQSPIKLKPGTQEAIFTNGSAIASTAVSHAAATMIAKEWSGAGAADIMDTARFHFLASVVHDERRSPAFQVRPLTPGELYPSKPGALEATIAGDPRYRLAGDTVAGLDTLDNAILEALGEDAVGTAPADGGFDAL